MAQRHKVIKRHGTHRSVRICPAAQMAVTLISYSGMLISIEIEKDRERSRSNPHD